MGNYKKFDAKKNKILVAFGHLFPIQRSEGAFIREGAFFRTNILRGTVMLMLPPKITGNKFQDRKTFEWPLNMGQHT